MRKILCLLCSIVLIICCTAVFAVGEDNSDLYENAIDLLKENKYSEAGTAFAALGSYNDSPRYTMYCNAIVAGETGFYSTAVENLKSLNGFLDSSLLATYYAGLSWEAAENYERAAEVMSGITLYRDVASRVAGYPALVKARDYKKADANEQDNKLEVALSGFKALGTYKDSAERAKAVQEKIYARDYAAADENEKLNKLEDALAGFKALGNYSDSPARVEGVQAKIEERDRAAAEQAKEDAYAAADQAEKAEDYATAYSGFLALGDYKDSTARAAAVQDKGNYARAMKFALSGKYADAYKIFSALGEYEDSAQKAYVTGVSTFASKITDLGNGTASFQFHGVWGIIDVATNTTASPNWDEIGRFNKFGLARVSKNKMYGYINRQGKVIVPCVYYQVSGFDDNGLCTVTRDESTGSGYSKKSYYFFGLYNSQGDIIAHPQWRALGESVNSNWGKSSSSAKTNTPAFSDGKIRVMTAEGLWGFIDTEGNQVGEIRWSDIGDFSEGLAAVTEDSKSGYIDPNGQVIIQPQYARARRFSEGLAWVKTSDGLWQCIDPSNNIVIPAKYSSVTEFKNGLADVELPNVGWQIIDAKGNLVYFINSTESSGQ